LIVIHEAPLVETELQPVVEVTVTLLPPPLELKDAVVGEIA
jgi:hypothetical protein